jgi:hypothetical protein
MLRVSPEFILLAPGARKSERTVMGNVAIAEGLAGLDELEELYRLDASETEPEDDTDDEDDEDGAEDGEDGGEEIHPEDMPHP